MEILQNGELILHGPVGNFYGTEGSFTSFDVISALTRHGKDKPITVRINCPGGSAFDGIAAFNALAAHKGKVTTVAEGLAASSGSVIFMAGAERVMADGALLMLHEAHSPNFDRPAADHRKQADVLEKITAHMASIYAGQSGAELDAMRRVLAAETWFNGAEAVAAGLATRSDSTKATTYAAFDYTAYRNAPDSLKVLAFASGWVKPDARIAALEAELAEVKAKLSPNPGQKVPPLAQRMAQAGPDLPPGGDAFPTQKRQGLSWADYVEGR